MPWTNATAAAVVSGEVVVVGDMIGVALGDIAIGATGDLAIEEVFLLAKEQPLVIAQGDTLYWDAVNLRIDKTNTNTPAGKAFAGAIEAATTVRVKINA